MSEEPLHGVFGTGQVGSALAGHLTGLGVAVRAVSRRAGLRQRPGRRADFIGHPGLPHSYSYVPDIAAGLATLGTDARAEGQVWHLPGPPTGSATASGRSPG